MKPQYPDTTIFSSWPPLPFEEWKETCETLQLWTQIVGKVRQVSSPFMNHWWHVTLYVHERGLTTSSIPYRTGAFEILFDFLDHTLVLSTSDNTMKTLPLYPMSVADFYHTCMGALHALGIDLTISMQPQEVAHPIPFDQDQLHRSYDPDAVTRFWHILLQVNTIMNQFRSGYVGKCSPVHFFWGSFDLAVSRFSGRRAPERKGADLVTREAYSHEVSSIGFWPGNGPFLHEPAFYAYTAPEPAGFSQAPIGPTRAFYQQAEWVLRYDDMRSLTHPERAVLEFFQSSYEAGARLGHWDRAALERSV